MHIGKVDTFHVETLMIQGDMYKLIGYLNQCDLIPGKTITVTDRKDRCDIVTSKTKKPPEE